MTDPSPQPTSTKTLSTPTEDIANQVAPPRRYTLDFYVVLLCAVIPVWSAVPLSWAFVLYTLRSGKLFTFGWRGLTLFTAALCEVFFSVYHFQLVRSISGPAPKGPSNLSELQTAFDRVLRAGLADGASASAPPCDGAPATAAPLEELAHDDPRAIDFRNALRPWFRHAPWSEVRRDDLRAWLYWAVFNGPLPEGPDALPHAHAAAMDDVEELIHRRAGCALPAGANPACRPLLLTVDAVNVWARPLAWYLLVAGVNLYLRKRMQYNSGVRHGSYDGLEYLLRLPTPSPSASTTSPSARPIVFMHGLGLGLLQYQLLLSHLFSAFPDRAVLVPLQPHISQDIFHPKYLDPMDRHETADCLAGLLRELGWVQGEEKEGDEEEAGEGDVVRGEGKGQVTMVSHSNGSYTHAWMLKAYPHMVARSCFVDPVTFCSWEGDVCYNFIYRPPANAMELLMRYFVSSELGVANLLQRNFCWSSNSLWYDEIPHARDPRRTTFFLGGKDAIVNAERVRKYLRDHGVGKGLWFDPNGQHGQALVSGSTEHDEIMRWIEDEP